MVQETDFNIFETLLRQESGLVITKEKIYLLESRLSPIAQKWGIKTLEELASKLRVNTDKELIRDVVEAMTTNETSFFRDNKPFDNLKGVILPHLKKARDTKKTIRIWSAACSSGQEPYSIAMILKELEPQFPGWKFEITATDISLDILDQAKKGVYTQFEVQRGLPIQFLVKHFEQQGEKWHLKQDLKDMITFKKANLLEPLSYLGKFDVIFCRNVLIYFDVETKGKVLHEMQNVLEEDGTLLLGGAETVLGITEDFKPMPGHKGLYVKQQSTEDMFYTNTAPTSVLQPA